MLAAIVPMLARIVCLRNERFWNCSRNGMCMMISFFLISFILYRVR